MRKLINSVLFLLISWNIFGQSIQFLTEYHDDIKVTYDKVYGENATVLYFPQLGQAIKEPLFFDLYEPVSDDLCPLMIYRPLIIFFHSGNFLPFPHNQNVVGTKRDSSVVEMCRHLASTGYVVASADYRLGWNPFATPELAARTGLINAAYRGVQDANTAIRYFKKTVVEENNPFGIDTSRIVLFGDDTGGYIAIHAGALDTYSKIPSASKGKFLIPTGDPNTPFVPMIIESLNGDVEGKKFGVMTEGIPIFPYPIGDTLNYPNHIEYSSRFKVAVNLAGAVADTAWIDPGQPSIISVHTPHDLTTPYKEDYLYVGEQRIIEVQGSYLVAYMENLHGNNSCLAPPVNATQFQFEVTDVANSRNDGWEGLFPIYGDTITDGTPWVFWDSEGPDSNINSEIGLMSNPNMSRDKAELYIDSIMAYVLPRLYKCLDLCGVGINDIVDPGKIDIITYPNPTFHEVFIATNKDFPIRSISVHDMKGAMVDYYANIDYNYFHLPVNKLIAGQYVLQFQFDQGIAARQITVQ